MPIYKTDFLVLQNNMKNTWFYEIRHLYSYKYRAATCFDLKKIIIKAALFNNNFLSFLNK